MAIGLTLGLIFAVLFIAGLVVFFYGTTKINLKPGKNGSTTATKTHNMMRWIGLGVGALFLILLIFLPASFHTVNSGEIAVVKHLGEIREVRTAGTYFDFWLTENYEIYDAKVQTLDIQDSAYSKDAQTMDLTMTVQYQIDTAKVKDIATTYGSLDVLSNRIRSVSIERAKSVLSSYSAMTIIETRAQISPEVEEAIKLVISDSYFVTVNTAVLTNIDFSDAFEQTVEQKMIAEQQQLQAQYEAEKARIEAEAAAQVARIEAEAALAVARLNAEAKIAAAEGDAEAQIRIAQAEARATKLKSIEVARMLGFKIDEKEVTNDDGEVSIEYTIDFTGKTAEEIALISEYLKYIEYLSKWDGSLPDVVTGDSASIIIPQP